MKRTTMAIAGLVLAMGLFLLGRCSAPDPPAPVAGSAMPAAEPGAETVWSCPMHPQIRRPEAGDCPICGMDLVPLESGAGEGDAPRRLVLSEAAKELARVETRPVERKELTREVRMAGKIDFDETAVRTISAWVPGRLDRLFVDYTGVPVREGDHLVRLYSPELLTAQEELLAAKERLERVSREASDFLAESDRRAYRAVRDKLLLWGLTEEQVGEIEERGYAEDSVMLTSPASGVVIEKLLREGAYVETGSDVYRIADLSRLWVRLDAYEQDLAWLRYGQEVAIRAEALPGEVFVGRISFISPVIDEGTRTASVRVNVDNSGGRLKPGMFVRAVARARIGAGGVVLGRHLAGKWISPMHPEIVEEGPGECDVCGMALVPAEDLGLVAERPAGAVLPLVVPASAVLVTGRRAVAYVEVPGTDLPTYEGREVLLGPRGGDEYVVLDGLEEGERVVVDGAFRIDSAMQIRARPSLMSLPAPADEAEPQPEPAAAAGASLEGVFGAYLAFQEALAADDGHAAHGAAAALLAESEALLADPALDERVAEHARALVAAARGAGESHDLERHRLALPLATAALVALADLSGSPLAEDLALARCPMARDGEGAEWLQEGEVIANPYFGAEMLRCGEVLRRLPAHREAR